MTTPLPWEPETKAQTQARFALAFTPDYDYEKVTRGEQPAPGLLRRHVFDLYCGIRMVVSIDVEQGQRSVHFSFGLPPHSTADPAILSKLAVELIKEFWHHPNTLDTAMTDHCYHVWCVPD